MGEEGVSGEGKGNTVKVEREKNVEKEEQNKKINKWEEQDGRTGKGRTSRTKASNSQRFPCPAQLVFALNFSWMDERTDQWTDEWMDEQTDK